MTKPKVIFVLSAVCCLLASQAYPQGVVHARGVKRNASGGVTARSGTAFRGPSGGEGARGRSVVTDGQGNATKTSGAAYRGPNGATANRSSTATVAMMEAPRAIAPRPQAAQTVHRKLLLAISETRMAQHLPREIPLRPVATATRIKATPLGQKDRVRNIREPVKIRQEM